MFQICDVSQITSSRTVCLIPKTQGDVRPSHLAVGKPRLGVPNPEIQLQVGVGLSRWRTCSVRGAFARRPPRTWARLPTHVFSGAGLQRDRALAPGDGPRSLSPDVSVTGAGGRALWAHTRSDLLLSRPSCPDSGLSVKTPSHRRPRAAKSLLPVLECTVPLLWSQTNTQYGGAR